MLSTISGLRAIPFSSFIELEGQPQKTRIDKRITNILKQQYLIMRLK
jgi:hypothetical protein